MTYIEKMLDSVLSNNNNKFELILVNDGAFDGSEVICTNAAVRDNRVKLINCENSGLCVARNIGMAAACGDYIWFVDADDFVVTSEIDDLIKFLDGLSTKPDIIYSNFFRLKENTIFWQSSYAFDVERVEKFDTKEALPYFWGDMHMSWAVWNKLFRRDFLRVNTLSFNKMFAHYEDGEFNLNAALLAHKFTVYPNPIYVYRTDSIHSLWNKKKTYKHFVWAHYFCLKWYSYFSCLALEDKNMRKVLVRLSQSYEFLLSFIGKMDPSQRRRALLLYRQNDYIAKFEENGLQ